MTTDGPDPLQWVSPLTDEADARLRAEGWTQVRRLHQMRRSLPLPDDLVAATRPIEVRSFTDADADGFLAVNNRAFSWHPDQGGWTHAQLDERRAEPWFRAEGFLIHDGPDGDDADGVIDGFCWTKVHPATDDDPMLGEIYVIAADPSTHGTGLGRALTVAGLEHLASLGIDVGMLYVEADNTAAVSLYERLGFEIHHSDAAYAPADPLAGSDSS